ncbi:MAG TPA: dephospho-CoA kinase [Pseudogracilibacillus sp.]|nr:dephospho-CoA kinase [Pseudogracilibacillus sp.]
MTLIIGLTGSIGTGKSTIAKKLIERNIPVIDADLIAREVVEPGKEAYEKIVETFGEEILQEDQTLDRKKLGAIVFEDETKRKALNEIVHPAIRKEMLAQRDAYMKQKEPCVVLDIPLLYESKLTHFVEKVIVVYTDREVQLERILNRDHITKEEALQRINAQIDVKEKAKWADAVIDNNGTIEESERQLLDILANWDVLPEDDKKT